MKSIFKDNKILAIVGLISIVNAVGYGIIIPVLYPYSVKFGLSDFQNGLLFSLFSLCQFLATPIIGRFSDTHGRKPLLIISVAGTALSFFLMAFAPHAIFLFIARALDGITAGNIPVISAVIADTTSVKDRAKGFGIIGASFGFGFIVGPAISAFTVGIADNMPFIVAGIIATIAVLLTSAFLPETNPHSKEQIVHKKFFDIPKLLHAVTDANVGPTLLITLFYWIAFSMYIYAFQPFSLKILNLSAYQISLLFTFFGILGLVTQLVILSRVIAWLGIKRAYSSVLGILIVTFLSIPLIGSFIPFLLSSMVLGIANAMVQPITQTILSQETDEKSQGSIQGLNASYMSIGQIAGPIIGGLLATMAIGYPFVLGGLCLLVCFFLSFQVLKSGVKKESAF